MNKQIFRGIILITLTISVLSFVLGYFYPSNSILAFYEHYNNNYTRGDVPILVLSLHYTSLLFLVVSVFGMFVFWSPSRLFFILSYLLVIPGYFIEPPFLYAPISRILYDIGMIGSGVILATMFLEPINSLFNKNLTKCSSGTHEKAS